MRVQWFLDERNYTWHYEKPPGVLIKSRYLPDRVTEPPEWLRLRRPNGGMYYIRMSQVRANMAGFHVGPPRANGRPEGQGFSGFFEYWYHHELVERQFPDWDESTVFDVFDILWRPGRGQQPMTHWPYQVLVIMSLLNGHAWSAWEIAFLGIGFGLASHRRRSYKEAIKAMLAGQDRGFVETIYPKDQFDAKYDQEILYRFPYELFEGDDVETKAQYLARTGKPPRRPKPEGGLVGDSLRRYGAPMSVTEIVLNLSYDDVEMSYNAVATALSRLKRDGYAKNIKGKWEWIEIPVDKPEPREEHHSNEGDRRSSIQP